MYTFGIAIYLFKHYVLHYVHINTDVHYVNIMYETICIHYVLRFKTLYIT
jgi:hypothetical protein